MNTTRSERKYTRYIRTWCGASLVFAILACIFWLAPIRRTPVRQLILAWVEGARYLDDTGVVHQKFQNDCGIACTRMTLQMLSRPLEEHDLPVITSPIGVTVADISSSLLREHVNNEPWFVAHERLHCVPPASILHLGFQHFVVLEAAEPYVLVRDPELGRLRFTQTNFLPMWDGKVIVVFTSNQAKSRFDACMG